MILSRACRALLLFVLAVGLLGVKRGAAQEVRITAEWVKENPGRLQTSGGSAFNGRNDYFFRLRVPTPREFEVVSLLIPSWTAPGLTDANGVKLRSVLALLALTSG